MAFIRHRGKTYSVVYKILDENGEEHTTSETFATQKEADKRKKEIEYKQSIGKFEVQKCVTLKELIEEYVQIYGHDKWGVSTYSGNVALINNYILPTIGDTKLASINTHFMEKYYKDLLKMPAVKSTKPVYYECTDGGEKDLKWMRASASMPGFSRVIHTDGYDLLDGGISDPVPLKYFQDIGYRRNVVILTQPRGYVKKSKRVEPLIKLILRKYPEIAKSMIERPRIYNQCMKYITLQEQTGDTLVIAPPYKLDIGKIEHNPEKIQTAYDIGRKTALENLEKVRDFLAGGKKD